MGKRVGSKVLLLSILRQEAHRSMRRQATSSATGHATKRHLYRSKALGLLFRSMQVLIDVDGCTTNGNRKLGGVAIVDDFKASTKGKWLSLVKNPARRNAVLRLRECLARYTRRKQYWVYSAHKSVSNHVITHARVLYLACWAVRPSVGPLKIPLSTLFS